MLSKEVLSLQDFQRRHVPSRLSREVLFSGFSQKFCPVSVRLFKDVLSLSGFSRKSCPLQAFQTSSVLFLLCFQRSSVLSFLGFQRIVVCLSNLIGIFIFILHNIDRANWLLQRTIFISFSVVPSGLPRV